MDQLYEIQIDELHTKLKTSMAETQEMKKEVAKLQVRLSETSRELEASGSLQRAKIKRIEEGIDIQLQNLRMEMNGRHADDLALERNLRDAVSEKLGAAQQAHKALLLEMQQQKEMLEAERLDRVHANERCIKLTRDMETLQKGRSDIRAQLSEVKLRLRSVDQARLSTAAKLEEKKKECGEMLRELDRARTRLATSEEKIRSTAEDNFDAQHTNDAKAMPSQVGDNTETKVAKQEVALDSLRNQLRSTLEQCAKLRSSSKRLREDCARKDDKIAALMEILSGLEKLSA